MSIDNVIADCTFIRSLFYFIQAAIK